MISPHLLIIDASYSQATYLGCLEGPPPVEHTIQGAETKAKELWGSRAVYVIEPTIKTVTGGSGKIKLLPKWQHMIWAHGPAKNEEMDGSELVVIWWSEMSPDTDRVLQVVDWERYAKDFGY